MKVGKEEDAGTLVQPLAVKDAVGAARSWRGVEGAASQSRVMVDQVEAGGF